MITEPMQLALRSVYRLDGIQGLALQHGSSLLFNQLPFSDRFATELAQEVNALFLGYASVGRKVTKLFISFGKTWFLVVSHGEARISIMTEQGCDLDTAASAADMFIRENFEMITAASNQPADAGTTTKPSVAMGTPIWQVKQSYLGILSKVMGQAQAIRLIERELDQVTKDDSGTLSVTNGEDLSKRILEKVPNRARRAALADEFTTAIAALFPKASK